MKDFLNELLPEVHRIQDLTFKSTEQIPELKTDRKAIFDIYCQSEKGSSFIVEMQKAKIDFFKDRTVFYMTFPIRSQAERGDWNFELKPVYCIALLDFEFKKSQTYDKERMNDYLSTVQLKDQYCNVFFDKLAYIFIEMPRFRKTEKELVTHFDKWLYFLKNLEDFNDIPEILKEEVFIECFRNAEIANYSQKELQEYEESLKVYRDMKAVIDTSFNDGVKSGRMEVAKNLKLQSIDADIISKSTGLTVEEIDKL